MIAFRYQIRQIRKTMFTKLSIPVYRYTQKLILYHDIQRKYRYFDISIRIAHHYTRQMIIINRNFRKGKSEALSKQELHQIYV